MIKKGNNQMNRKVEKQKNNIEFEFDIDNNNLNNRKTNKRNSNVKKINGKGNNKRKPSGRKRKKKSIDKKNMMSTVKDKVYNIISNKEDSNKEDFGKEDLNKDNLNKIKDEYNFDIDNKKENVNVKKKKNKIDSRTKKLILLILFIISVIYILYTIYLLIKQPTNVFTVEEGKLYKEETLEGYIIRNEKIIKGKNYKNGIEQIKVEGEKTAKNENIYRYYSTNENNLKNKIAEMDAKIQEVMVNDNSLNTSDMKLVEAQIDERLDGIDKVKDFNKLIENQKEIDKLVNKKAKMAGDSSPQGSTLRKLIEERKSYESQLNSGAEYVKAPISGVVSYRVDGLEEKLTPENMSTLGKDYLEKLNLKPGKIVASSEEAGKVIDNFVCYIATISNSKEAQNAKVGDRIKIRLSNNVEIPAKIININVQGNDRVIILEINKEIEELINYRKISFDLIWWSSTGLKVPNKAIVKIDDLDYVVRNRAGYLTKMLVKVTKKGDNYSIVKPYSNEELRNMGMSSKEIMRQREISIYDEIVLNPDMSKVEED